MVALAQFVARAAARTNEAVQWQLLPQAQVDSSGIFLDQIVSSPTATVVLPHLRLAPAPNLGQAASLSRSQITVTVQKLASELITTNWSGAAQVRVSRRTRQFTESDLMDMLATTLQKEFVKNRGELEIHIARPGFNHWPGSR